MNFLNVPIYRRGLLAIALMCTATSALCKPLTLKDEQQIRAVVQGQLDAFAKDDAEKAFSFAAPNIRRLMVSADIFMDMVRDQYEVVYRPASVALLKPQGDGDEAVIKVLLTDEDDDPWVATYTLQRQKNKLWRITGCVVNEASGTMV